jgi:hypothetical protein
MHSIGFAFPSGVCHDNVTIGPVQELCHAHNKGLKTKWQILGEVAVSARLGNFSRIFNSRSDRSTKSAEKLITDALNGDNLLRIGGNVFELLPKFCTHPGPDCVD